MSAEPTRRQLLCGLAVALVAPAGIAAACSSDGGGTGGGPTSPSLPPDAPEGAIVAVKSVPVGGGVLGFVGQNPVLVVQPKAGSIVGFDATCPHQGFTVNPPQQGKIVCPGHGSTFDATTGALETGPAPTGLTKVPVRVVQGYVVSA